MGWARGLLIPLGITLSRGALWSFFPGFGGGVMLLVSFVLLGVWWVVAVILAIRALFQRAWVRAGRLGLAAAVAVPLVPLGIAAGDYVHLGLLYPYYRSRISATPERPVTFDWGDQAIMVIDGLISRTLVYDETGTPQIGPPGEGLAAQTERLVGPFYIRTVTNR